MIKIDPKDHRLEITTDRDYTLPELVDVLFRAALFAMRETLKKVPEAKPEIFDMVNYKASALLEHFAPEYELRPGLTEEAIMKAENEILEDEMSKMQ